MSEIQRKIQFSRKKGVFVFRWPQFYERAFAGVYTYRIPEGRYYKGDWAIYVEGEFSPRVGFSKREAVNLAYAVAIAKKLKLRVEVL